MGQAQEIDHLAVHFLDNLVEVKPLTPSADRRHDPGRTLKSAWVSWDADMLISLDSHHTEEAIDLAEKVMHFIKNRVTRRRRPSPIPGGLSRISKDRL
jgi:hypothetical protein